MLSYTIMVNCIVHVFMYTYYLSSAIADRLPFSLKRVKKFVTTLQIVCKTFQLLVDKLLNFTFVSGAIVKRFSEHRFRAATKLCHSTVSLLVSWPQYGVSDKNVCGLLQSSVLRE